MLINPPTMAVAGKVIDGSNGDVAVDHYNRYLVIRKKHHLLFLQELHTFFPNQNLITMMVGDYDN